MRYNEYLKKSLLQDILLILVISLVPLLWYKSGCIINGADVCYPLDPITFFCNRLSTWNSFRGAGSSNLMGLSTLPTLFFHGAQAFFFFITGSLIATQYLSYIFWFSIIGLSMYFFMATVTVNKSNSRVWRLTSVIFYLFNPFVFNIWESGKAAELSCLVAMPFLLAMLIRGLREGSHRFKIILVSGLASLIFSEMGASPSVIAIPVIICTTYFLMTLIVNIFKRAKGRKILADSSFFVLFVTFYALINAYWIIPGVYDILSTLQSNLSNPLEAFNMTNWLVGISQNTSILNVSRFMGSWDWYVGWNDEPYVLYAKTYFQNPLYILMSVFLPILAYSALIFRKSKNVLYFTFLSISSTLFAIGVHSPYGFLFAWVCEKVPIFLVFRSPYYKFSLATVFAYAYLGGATISYLHLKLKTKLNISQFNKFIKVYAFIAVAIILLGLYLMYNFPMLTGGIIPVRKKMFSLQLKFPNYVFKTGSWIKSENSPPRFISLPKENLDTYRWGYGSPENIVDLFGYNSVIWGTFSYDGKYPPRDVFYEILYNDKTRNGYKVLQLLGVNYVWLRHDAWYDFYYKALSPEILGERLSHQKNIDFNKRIGEWDFYKVNNPYGLITQYSEAHLIYGDASVLIPMSNRQHERLPLSIFRNDIQDEALEYLINKDAIKTIYFYNGNSDKILEKSKNDLNNYSGKFSFIYETNSLNAVLNHEYELPEHIKVGRVLGFEKSTKHDQIRDWLWLTTNKKTNLIITNDSSNIQITNLIFDVFTYNTDRSLYVYLNDKLLQYQTLEADTIHSLLVKNIALVPGKNVISFYTPYPSEIRGGRSVTFAFKNIKFGMLKYLGEFYLPAAGSFYIKLYPYSLETFRENRIKDYNEKYIYIDGNPLKLEMGKDFTFESLKISLGKGNHNFCFNQLPGKGCYVDFIPIGNYTHKTKNLFYQKLNSTSYKICNPKNSTFFVFNESYHNKWQIKNSNISTNYHIKANGFANCWFIDGNKDYYDEIKLKFIMQDMFILGLYVSGSSILVMFFIAFTRGRTIHGKN